MTHVCVFTGSRLGALNAYRTAARKLGNELVSRGWTLVYGGAKVGLMGVLADAVLARGGQVVGVIPEHLVAKEVAHPGLTELRVVASMHERKTVMSELADGVVALPGGLGTLEELFETLTWAQLGLHGKPCGVLNVGGYFDRLLAFLDHAVDQRFLAPEHRSMVLAEREPAVLLDRFSTYVPPVSEKWLDRTTS
ncbi:MAG: TIGR00730 family Rossman fold protein [Acidobacteriota bacterium]|nr:TIGR00730 family Rossman fold protein [Acidobacteriota bacterium]